MARDGETLVIRVDTGSNNFEDMGGETSHDLEKTRDTIETTSKADDKKTYIYGKGDSTLSVDVLHSDGDAARSALEDARDNGDTVTVRTVKDGNADEEATALVESISQTAPDNDNAEFTIDLQVTGAWSSV